ncbi:MAG TPA: hypothetical protein VHY33_09760, partial [Thermoanaerobaculia bacterium]|nr:hypothetical protein [Thermoanaerobaculia bacterium]
MYATFVFAVIVIAILIVKRTLWDHYEPEVPGKIEELRRVDWTPAAINVFAWLAGIALVLAAVYAVQSMPKGGWLAVAIGIGIGIALLLVSAAIASKYGITADAIDGAGIGILYVTCYA